MSFGEKRGLGISSTISGSSTNGLRKKEVKKKEGKGNLKKKSLSAVILTVIFQNNGHYDRYFHHFFLYRDCYNEYNITA